jgi:protease-4
MKKFWIVIGLICALTAAGLFGGWFLLQRLGTPTGPVGGVLVWRVDADYPERRDEGAFAALAGRDVPVMHEITAALSRAARDERVTGLFLEIAVAPADWADVEELRDAIAVFAASGKPVTAWLSFAGSGEYALALAADRVVLAPEGNLMVPGASAQMQFLAGTLEKLGMTADYVHVGRYKSAPEAMTRTDATGPHREMVASLVEEHYRGLVAMIARDRGLGEATVAELVDQGLFDAAGALAAALVDTLDYRDAALEADFGDAETTLFEDYVLSPGRGRGERVALVTVEGTIVEGDSGRDFWSGPLAGSDTVIEQLRDAAEDDGVAAVVLRVDSPGGSATASDLIWDEINRTRLDKPVVVSMSGYAASGGYYVACPADSIFAEPGTLTGSIGVFAGKMDRHLLYEKIGLNREFVVRGRNALMFADTDRFDDAQRALLQGQLDAFYGRFVGKVAAGRRLDPAAVAAVAEGRVWTGRQAIDAGLVDGLGGLDRALAAVRGLVGLEADAPLHLVSFDREPSLFERLLSQALRGGSVGSAVGDAVDGAAWTGPWREFAGSGLLAQARLLDGRPLALLPLRLEFR